MTLPMPRDGLTAYQQTRWSSWSPENQRKIWASLRLLTAQRRLRRARKELEEAKKESRDAQNPVENP